MRAGRLDRRVMLFRAVTTRSPLNEPVKTWLPFPGMPGGGIAARRDPVRDLERQAAQQLGASVTDRFTLRWARSWADVNPKDELVCEGRRYGIVAVKELGRRRGLEITAVARADV